MLTRARHSKPVITFEVFVIFKAGIWWSSYYRGAKSFQQYRKNLKIVGSRRVTVPFWRPTNIRRHGTKFIFPGSLTLWFVYPWARRSLLSILRDCVFSTISATCHFANPQPEDRSCCGTKGPTWHVLRKPTIFVLCCIRLNVEETEFSDVCEWRQKAVRNDEGWKLWAVKNIT
jgi:hypothetical protein